MAGVLTENLVLQKTKVDNIQRVRKLNVCAAQLSDIGVLRRACNLEILSLSLNELTEIGVLENCRRLCELYLRKNRIEDLNQVLHLSDSPNLAVLNLAENPICQDPNYRRFVIAAIGSLRRLDDIDILPQEREEAYRVFPNLQSIAPPPSMYCDPARGKVRPAAGHSTAATPAARRGAGAAKHRPDSGAEHDAEHSTRFGGGGQGPAGGNAVRRKKTFMETQRDAPEPLHSGLNGGLGAMQMAPLQIGPTETGVVQAVKVLLSELSAESLNEVRRFIDALN